MKAEHIDALHALAREDAAVCATLHAMYASGADWEETLIGLIANLVQDKVALTRVAVDAKSREAPRISSPRELSTPADRS